MTLSSVLSSENYFLLNTQVEWYNRLISSFSVTATKHNRMISSSNLNSLLLDYLQFSIIFLIN